MSCRARRARGALLPPTSGPAAALAALALLAALPLQAAGEEPAPPPAAAPAITGAADAATAADSRVAPGVAAADTIGFSEALRIALERNSGLLRAENALVADQAAVRGAGQAMLPDLRLSLSGAQDYGRFFSETEGAVLNQTSESLNARASSSVVLFDGLGNLSTLREARRSAEAGRRSLERARQSVIFTVASGYLALIEAREQVRIQAENLLAQQEQERLVAGLVEGGSRPVSDLYQQRATVASVRLALVEAERAVAVAELELVGTLRLEPTGRYAFLAPPLPAALDTSAAPAAEEMVARALAARPDLRAQAARLDAAASGEAAARAGRWPTLTLSLGYGTSYTSASILDFSEQVDQRRGGSLGLGLAFPVFDRYATGRRIEQARVARLNARLDLEDLRQEVALQVRRAVLDLRTAQRRLELADARLASAREAHAATRERYLAGVATMVEVTLARAELVRAESDLASARYNLALQDTLLRYHVGDLEPGAALGG